MILQSCRSYPAKYFAGYDFRELHFPILFIPDVSKCLLTPHLLLEKYFKTLAGLAYAPVLRRTSFDACLHERLRLWVNMLAQEEVQKYKTRLEAERQRVSGEISREEKPEDFGSDIDDLDEEKNEAEALANRLAVGQALRDRLSEIDGALARISEGTYGVCASCGKPISNEVLHAAPESRLCANCKKT